MADLLSLCFCLQVIAKSVSLLSPADVLKLLQSLISIIQSRYKPRLIMGTCLSGE